MSVIIGIDPGLAATGYGIVRTASGRIACVDYGVIRTGADLDTGQRLDMVYTAVEALVREHRPDFAGIEGLYFTRNVTSAIPVAQARGVVLLALTRNNVPAREFTPQQIKQAVVGNGQADKEQVMQMVRVVLGMSSVPRPDHAADALAAAITLFHFVPGG